MFKNILLKKNQSIISKNDHAKFPCCICWSLVVSILVIHFFLILGVNLNNSPTTDEIAHHIATGYSYIKTGDFCLNPADPPLVRMIAVIPLLIINPKLPLDHISWKDAEPAEFGRQFFYVYNSNSALLVTLARLSIALLSVLLGILVFLWSQKIYGSRGGLLSLFFYSFSPNIIAHASVVTADIGSALFFSLALFSFWLYVKHSEDSGSQRWGWFFFAIISFGLAQSAKFTNVLLAPIYISILFALLLFHSMKICKNIGLLLAIFIGGYIVVFFSYFCEIKPFFDHIANVSQKVGYLKNIFSKFNLSVLGFSENNFIKFFFNNPVPFRTYIVGLLGIVHQGVEGHRSYLLGNWSQFGQWYYFLVAWLVKSTIPFIIILFTSVVLFFRQNKTKKYDEIFLLVPVVIYLIFVSTGKVKIGIRHILQIYPLLFVFIGGIMRVYAGITKKYLCGIFIAILCGWHVFSLFTAYPYPLAYFNELSGGPKQGYKILRDSNIDWGQGLIALEKYVTKNKIAKIRLLYFGSADPAYYGINYEKVEDPEFSKPKPAIYAISVNYLDAFSWARTTKPVAKIAWSIYIYDLRPND